jgi:dihydroorotate dehydrogenase (NAD+) catalytic subunit
MKPSLKVNIGKISLPNPVMVASGTFGYGLEAEGIIDIKKIGAIITKGISLKPRKGNPPPRIIEVYGGILNSIGLQNIGVEAFVKEKLPELKKAGVRVVVNIFGDTVDEYRELARILDKEEGITALEVNISCPNRKEWGKIFAHDPKLTGEVVNAVRGATSLPVIVKLSPNVTDIGEIALSAESNGADAISAINTVIGMVIDIEQKRPILKNITGGFSGPAIKPIAMRCVWEVIKRVKIPVIGIGGIMNARDALEFLMIGARAIQVGTATFVNPDSAIGIIRGIQDYLSEKKISTVEEIIGVINLGNNT